MKKTTRLFLAIIASILPITLSQCVMSNSDPGFDALVNTADTNPSPTAVVGMWHRLDSRDMLNGSTSSILFQSNGTLVVQARSMLLGTDAGRTVNSCGYYYVGSGIWRTVDNEATFVLSQGHLLFHHPIPEVYDVQRYIFDRVK